MTRIPLSETSDYALKFDEHDVRGYDVLDENGNRIGRVERMIVNTDEERVDALVLENGSEIPIDDVSIGDGVVRATRTDPSLMHREAQPHIDGGTPDRRRERGRTGPEDPFASPDAGSRTEPGPTPGARTASGSASPTEPGTRGAGSGPRPATGTTPGSASRTEPGTTRETGTGAGSRPDRPEDLF